MSLSSEECEACSSDATPVAELEQQQLLGQLAGWHIVHDGDLPQLKKEYSFSNFIEALNFTIKVGDIAESAGHHPALLTEWGKVTVRWWSHEMGGLHKNDFILAARTDVVLMQA